MDFLSSMPHTITVLLGSVLIASILFALYYKLKSPSAPGRKNTGEATGKANSFFKPGAPPSEFVKFTLIDKIPQTHNTEILRFALPSGPECLGIPPAKHVAIRAFVNGEEVQRSYTPISSDYEMLNQFQSPVVDKKCRDFPIKDEDGTVATSTSKNAGDVVYFDLFIKVYSEGKLTRYLSALKVGSQVEMKGPTGLHQYLGGGNFLVGRKVFRCHSLGMITGGTGVTPMIQLVKEILCDEPSEEDQKIQVYGIYANSTLDDVLCRDFLEGAARMYPERFKLHFTVSRLESALPEGEANALKAGWTYGVGRINSEMLKAHLPAASYEAPPPTNIEYNGKSYPVIDVGSVIALCGPAAMINESAKPMLASLGFSKDQIIVL